MNNILSELEYENYIIERLVQDNGYIERNHKCFDEKFAFDRELLMQFFMQTQPDEMATASADTEAYSGVHMTEVTSHPASMHSVTILMPSTRYSPYSLRNFLSLSAAMRRTLILDLD